MSELQRVVDSLARGTGRAVSVQDRARRLLAYSAHDPSIDDVRKELILTRRGPERGFAWARRFGIETVAEPVRIPMNEAIGMTARVCAPVRFDDRLLGFLWLADPDSSLSDEAMELVRSAANAAALAIHQQELMERIDRSREREVLRDLLSSQPDVRAHAADELLENELLAPVDVFTVLVVRPTRGREPIPRGDRAASQRLERALGKARADTSPRQALHLARPDHGVMVVTAPRHRAGALAAEIAAKLRIHATDVFDSRGSWHVAVGVGDERTELEEIEGSYVQARRAAEACSVFDHLGPIAFWSDLGVYQTLLRLPISEIDSSHLPAGLAKLFAAPDADTWLRTLECYLDRGCNAQRAANTLGVNKSSLYHRLHRIEEIAGVSLESGDDRLALHLGLKLARLGGMLHRA